MQLGAREAPKSKRPTVALSTAEREELVRLRKHVLQLEMKHDFLNL